MKNLSSSDPPFPRQKFQSIFPLVISYIVTKSHAIDFSAAFTAIYNNEIQFFYKIK